MNDNEFVVKAKNLDLALEEVRRHFDTSLENIEVEVINNPKKIFGINLSSVTVKAVLKKIEPKKEEETEIETEPEIEIDIDGAFSFEFREDGVALILSFAQGKGINVNENKIYDKAEKKKIKDIDINSIADSIVKRLEENIIAPFQEEEKVDEQAVINVSNDKLEAYIEFSEADGGKELGYDDVVALVQANGIVYGVDNELLKNLVEQKNFGMSVKFAQGTPPIDGKDGVIVNKIEFTSSQRPKELGGGYVDYYERETFNTVKTGDVIAEYIKPVPCVNGKNVLGEDIVAKEGKELPLPVGENVEVSEDGSKIIASTDGVAEIKNDKYFVSNILTIDGNVDLSVGNIHFEGNVKISGNVAACISITAEGSVEILGTVEGASITSKGDIRLKRGILGGGKGILKADGDVYAKFIENATVIAKKNIYASSIIHSNVESYESIIVSGDKGMIFGGTAKATNKITAQCIGSNANVATIIEIGISPCLREEYDELQEKMKKLNDELNYISNVIDLSKGQLNARQQEIKSKLVADRLRKRFSLDSVKKEMEQLNEKIESETQSSVNVSQTIYPGAKITIKTLTYVVNSTMSFSTFKIHDGEIVVISYNDK